MIFCAPNSPRASQHSATSLLARSSVGLSGSQCARKPEFFFNDCGGVDSDTQPRGYPLRRALSVEQASLRGTGEPTDSRCNSGPQSPSVLLAVLSIPGIVIATGLVWSLV